MSSFPAAPAAPAVTQLWAQRATSVLSGAAASVGFSGLTDSAYRLTCNYAFTSAVGMNITVNSDTGANYDQEKARAASGSNDSARATGSANWAPPSNPDTGLAAGIQMVIQKPLAAQHAHMVYTYACHRAAGNDEVAVVASGRWTNTAAKITRIDVNCGGNFTAGSTFTVEGIA